MKSALHSVSYCGFWGQERLSLEEFIPHAAKLGYAGISLVGKRPHASPLDMNPDRIAKVKKLVAGHNLELISIAGYTDLARGNENGIPFDEFQIAFVEEMGKLAKLLDCGKVRVFTAYEHGTANIRALWNQTVRIMRECAERVAPLGVTLAVQNHHDVGVATEAMFEFINEVDRPNCRAGFDAWSPALNGEDIYKAAKTMAPLTVLTTCADYVQLPRFNYLPAVTNYVPASPPLTIAVPFGDGFIDYKSFFKGLREGGYDGYALYEMCEKLRGGGSMENLDRCARKFVDYMKAFK